MRRKAKAQPAQNLTVKRIERLTSAARGRLGRHRDAETRGLYLQVERLVEKDRPPAASWVLRYERQGREYMLGLGSLQDFDLEQARTRARVARQKLADGIDPLQEKKAAKQAAALEAAKAVTFEQAAQQYYDKYQATWRNRKHAAQFLSTLKTYAYPVIGTFSVADIDTALVLKVIEPHWQTKTETMSRVRQRIEAVLAWATVNELRTGDNPARWRNHLSKALPERGKIAKPVHHAALPFDELPAFMQELRQREGTSARALELLILTAARTGEVIGARWPEMDLKEKTWTVPADRIKGGREHKVPLSDRAVEILKALPREKNNDFIFIGPSKGAGLSNMAMAALLTRMKRDTITVHGFRSTFRDWAAERTAYPNHVVEKALAHVVADKVEAAYRRGDLYAKRTRLMNDWARYCTSTPVRAGSNVVVLQGMSQ